MIINRQNSIIFFRKDQIIRGLAQFTIVILIWIWIWVIEEVLFNFGILQFNPVLVIPTGISLKILKEMGDIEE